MSIADIANLHAFCNPNKCQCFQSGPSSPVIARNVLIIGGGVFGLSTALHLLRRGNRTITILDSGNNNDNRSNRPLLSRDAAAAWRSDALFSRYFHETGAVVCSRNGNASVRGWRRGRPDTQELVSAEDFRRIVSPALLGHMSGWKGWLCAQDSGWIDAHGALSDVADECRRMGAKIVAAEVVEILYRSSGKVEVVGVRCSDGREFYADRTVIADSLHLVEFQGQIRQRYWTLAPAALYDEQIAMQMRGRPVLVNADNGFFILEPDQSGQVIACHGLPAYALRAPTSQGGDINQLLAETLGTTRRLAGMPRSCMSYDTLDGEFLITEHPFHRNLIVAVGGGDAFELLPTVGMYVTDVVARGDGGQRRQYKWRPEMMAGNLEA